MEKFIFIVDDDSIDREFFSIMFPLFGFRVQTADSPQQGLRLLRDLTPDLILIDNHIKGFNSLEIVTKIKTADEYKNVHTTPIMMLSHVSDPQAKMAGYEVGVEDFIIKPYNFLEILARVRAVVRTKDLTEQIIQRERRMTLIESLNNSLIYFSKNLRSPMLELITKSEFLLNAHRNNHDEHIVEFLKKVKLNAESTIATLNGLEDEVRELLSEDEQIKSEQVTLEVLEQKYRSHFNRYQEQYIKLHQKESGMSAGESVAAQQP